MLFAEGLSKFTVALRAASLRFFLVAAVALLLPSLAQATVVARNLYSADDYVLTYDSETNLEWLDWNSALVPLAETAARLQPGGFFDGNCSPQFGAVRGWNFPVAVGRGI